MPLPPGVHAPDSSLAPLGFIVPISPSVSGSPSSGGGGPSGIFLLLVPHPHIQPWATHMRNEILAYAQSSLGNMHAIELDSAFPEPELIAACGSASSTNHPLPGSLGLINVRQVAHNFRQLPGTVVLVRLINNPLNGVLDLAKLDNVKLGDLGEDSPEFDPLSSSPPPSPSPFLPTAAATAPGVLQPLSPDLKSLEKQEEEHLVSEVVASRVSWLDLSTRVVVLLISLPLLSPRMISPDVLEHAQKRHTRLASVLNASASIAVSSSGTSSGAVPGNVAPFARPAHHSGNSLIVFSKIGLKDSLAFFKNFEEDLLSPTQLVYRTRAAIISQLELDALPKGSRVRHVLGRRISACVRAGLALEQSGPMRDTLTHYGDAVVALRELAGFGVFSAAGSPPMSPSVGPLSAPASTRASVNTSTTSLPAVGPSGIGGSHTRLSLSSLQASADDLSGLEPPLGPGSGTALVESPGGDGSSSSLDVPELTGEGVGTMAGEGISTAIESPVPSPRLETHSEPQEHAAGSPNIGTSGESSSGQMTLEFLLEVRGVAEWLFARGCFTHTRLLQAELSVLGLAQPEVILSRLRAGTYGQLEKEWLTGHLSFAQWLCDRFDESNPGVGPLDQSISSSALHIDHLTWIARQNIIVALAYRSCVPQYRPTATSGAAGPAAGTSTPSSPVTPSAVPLTRQSITHHQNIIRARRAALLSRASTLFAAGAGQLRVRAEKSVLVQQLLINSIGASSGGMPADTVAAANGPTAGSGLLHLVARTNFLGVYAWAGRNPVHRAMHWLQSGSGACCIVNPANDQATGSGAVRFVVPDAPGTSLLATTVLPTTATSGIHSQAEDPGAGAGSDSGSVNSSHTSDAAVADSSPSVTSAPLAVTSDTWHSNILDDDGGEHEPWLAAVWCLEQAATIQHHLQLGTLLLYTLAQKAVFLQLAGHTALALAVACRVLSAQVDRQMPLARNVPPLLRLAGPGVAYHRYEQALAGVLAPRPSPSRSPYVGPQGTECHALLPTRTVLGLAHLALQAGRRLVVTSGEHVEVAQATLGLGLAMLATAPGSVAPADRAQALELVRLLGPLLDAAVPADGPPAEALPLCCPFGLVAELSNIDGTSGRQQAPQLALDLTASLPMGLRFAGVRLHFTPISSRVKMFGGIIPPPVAWQTVDCNLVSGEADALLPAVDPVAGPTPHRFTLDVPSSSFRSHFQIDRISLLGVQLLDSEYCTLRRPVLLELPLVSSIFPSSSLPPQGDIVPRGVNIQPVLLPAETAEPGSVCLGDDLAPEGFLLLDVWYSLSPFFSSPGITAATDLQLRVAPSYLDIEVSQTPPTPAQLARGSVLPFPLDASAGKDTNPPLQTSSTQRTEEIIRRGRAVYLRFMAPNRPASASATSMAGLLRLLASRKLTVSLSIVGPQRQTLLTRSMVVQAPFLARASSAFSLDLTLPQYLRTPSLWLHAVETGTGDETTSLWKPCADQPQGPLLPGSRVTLLTPSAALVHVSYSLPGDAPAPSPRRQIHFSLKHPAPPPPSISTPTYTLIADVPACVPLLKPTPIRVMVVPPLGPEVQNCRIQLAPTQTQQPGTPTSGGASANRAEGIPYQVVGPQSAPADGTAEHIWNLLPYRTGVLHLPVFELHMGGSTTPMAVSLSGTTTVME
ncbi:hypothetical protein, variant [Fonticula alba]|uniref:Uncharacterized protein n=1 Tax=Fonticula alba TaxID=691883 RepID=A0A058ZDU5_FONAL|nr:hypothetical protein, variant [Fonticula alba]KCV71637.1 hypothetical protein, variant [Fonticula alba]|eukprot:XP_009493214.1 hypothetical protein, variant [Fonticula alba]